MYLSLVTGDTDSMGVQTGIAIEAISDSISAVLGVQAPYVLTALALDLAEDGAAVPGRNLIMLGKAGAALASLASGLAYVDSALILLANQMSQEGGLSAPIVESMLVLTAPLRIKENQEASLPGVLWSLCTLRSTSQIVEGAPPGLETVRPELMARLLAMLERGDADWSQDASSGILTSWDVRNEAADALERLQFLRQSAAVK